MATESLIQVALVISIIALLLFVLVMVRSYFVLSDVNEISQLLNKRLKEADRWCLETGKSVKGFFEMVKTIISSFNQFKSIGEKVINKFHKEEKGEENG